jgi:hypothetical protein
MTDEREGSVAANIVRLNTDATLNLGPELLPVGLATACTKVLHVDGAGIGLFLEDEMRVPLGASDPEAGFAERLQFSFGLGPCFAAQAEGRTVIATEAVIARRWPAYHRELVRRTRYRGVVSIPLTRDLEGAGVLDLYFRNSADIDALVLEDVRIAVDTITEALTDMPHDHGAGAEPDWLNNPYVYDRSKVWIAIGMINESMGVHHPDALAVMREYSYARRRTVDETADDLCHRRMPVSELLRG